MEGQVPNISEPNRGGINEKWHIRRGRVCIVPTVNSQSSGSLRSLYYTSLASHGPRLFNSVPATIRNMTDCSVDTFKRCLDKYLGMVPDEPHICGYTALRRAESNSLFDMAQFASAQLISALEEPDQPPIATLGLIPESIHKYPQVSYAWPGNCKILIIARRNTEICENLSRKCRIT